METLRADPSWFEIDPQFYRHGGSCLNPSELDAMDVHPGQAVLVSPPGNGEEALSFANLGARVTVMGSAQAMQEARELAADSGIKVEFAEGDPASVSSRSPFDTVYCPWGTLDQLEEFEPWAAAIAAVLKPGGRLVLSDRHPFSSVAAVHKGMFVIGRSYFDDGLPAANGWTLGDLVSSLGAEGLATMLLDEFPASDRFTSPLDRLGIRWDIRWRIPGALLLVAVRVR
jgi:SAM-dependent methyltransferase